MTNLHLNWLDRRNTIERQHRWMSVNKFSTVYIALEDSGGERVQVDINPDSMQVEILNIRSYFGCDDEC